MRRARVGPELIIETALVLALWAAIAAAAPDFFLLVYLPGWAIGLGLCQLQGHFEHAGGTTSHYGRIYNWLFFNDGYHVEHHLKPGAHWTELRRLGDPQVRHSPWPPVLRWVGAIRLDLERLERLVLRSRRLQRFVIAAHERAFRRLIVQAGEIRQVVVVGGGLFPRTAIVLERILPAATITIVDANADHLATARPFLGAAVRLVHDAFDPSLPSSADLVVIPLSFVGDLRLLYERPPARAVLIHDWIWAARAGGSGAIVSWLLLKRLNLVLCGRQTKGGLVPTSAE